jgi:hypothetical protein
MIAIADVWDGSQATPTTEYCGASCAADRAEEVWKSRAAGS